jgi:hypothetical protein
MSRRRSRPVRRSQRTDLPLRKLIPLLLILALIWLYQNGYFNRWLEQLPESPIPSAGAPELDDGSEPEAAGSPEPTVPQPSVASQPAPPPLENVETDTMRGFSGSWYQVYFTKPQYPERAANRVGGLDETIVADIDTAQRRVELVSCQAARRGSARFDRRGKPGSGGGGRADRQSGERRDSGLLR